MGRHDDLVRPAMHRVVVLALDEAIALDIGVPRQMFHGARDANRMRYYDVKVTTPDGLPVRSSAGFLLTPEHGPDILDTAQTVIVAGIDTASRHFTPTIDPMLRAAFDRVPETARIMSICTGAFVLGAAGLLDGHRATTHWAYEKTFREWFPHVDLDPDVLFVDEGNVLTSAGVAAGIDLCLHVIRRDHGSEVANRAARRGVVAPWRDGGQSQFIERPLPGLGETSTAATRAWAAARLHDDLDLEALARHARMSTRTFTRRFRADTGMSPGRWITARRVELARRLLETTDLSIDRVASEAGFGTATSLRQHLRSEIGLAPHAYRRSFRGGAADGAGYSAANSERSVEAMRSTSASSPDATAITRS